MLCYNIMAQYSLCWRAALMLLVTLLPRLGNAYDTPAFTQLSDGKTIAFDTFEGQSLLVAFWRSDCAPCVTEKPILLEVAKEHPLLRIVIVSLQDRATTLKHLDMPATNIQILLAKDDATEILRMMNDTRAALPYSVFLHTDGTVCESRTGLLGTRIVEEWMKRC